MDISKSLNKKLGEGRVEKNKSLFPFFTLRVQTVAEYFVEVLTRDEFIRCVQFARKKNIPFTLIGGGSNMAPVVDLLPGIVMKNSYAKMNIIKEDDNNVELLISSGYIMSLLVNKSIDMGWGGFEYHKGLPGTLGGAIHMNSKWTNPKSYAGDHLVDAVILDTKGDMHKVDRSYFQFSHGFSILQKNHEVFLEGRFVLKKTNPSLLRARADKALDHRMKTQPIGVATSGCFFRNITEADKERLGLPTTSSGYLIEKAGLKNLSVGSFKVSDIHANFIVNTGAGKADTKDLLELVHMIKSKIRQQFELELREEVVVI